MDNEHDLRMVQFSEIWEQYLDDETHQHYELACVVSNWITWLWEKPRELTNLDQELSEVKFAAWRELLDFHLWNEPKSLEEALSQTAPEKVEQYLSFFKQCQELAQERLEPVDICSRAGDFEQGLA